jgi:hypothetical protein
MLMKGKFQMSLVNLYESQSNFQQTLLQQLIRKLIGNKLF